MDMILSALLRNDFYIVFFCYLIYRFFQERANLLVDKNLSAIFNNGNEVIPKTVYGASSFV